jgi:hypothetical protein
MVPTRAVEELLGTPHPSESGSGVPVGGSACGMTGAPGPTPGHAGEDRVLRRWRPADARPVGASRSTVASRVATSSTKSVGWPRSWSATDQGDGSGRELAGVRGAAEVAVEGHPTAPVELRDSGELPSAAPLDTSSTVRCMRSRRLCSTSRVPPSRRATATPTTRRSSLSGPTVRFIAQMSRPRAASLAKEIRAASVREMRSPPECCFGCAYGWVSTSSRSPVPLTGTLARTLSSAS